MRPHTPIFFLDHKVFDGLPIDLLKVNDLYRNCYRFNTSETASFTSPHFFDGDSPRRSIIGVRSNLNGSVFRRYLAPNNPHPYSPSPYPFLFYSSFSNSVPIRNRAFKLPYTYH